MKARFPAQKAVKIKKSEMLVPGVDVWRAFKGEVQIATLQSLPITLRRLEERMRAEEARLSSTTDKIVSATKNETLAWIRDQLRPYVRQLAQLSGK